MAVTETPPETVAAASETAPSAPRSQATGLAAVLGSGDHKVIGRLYLATSIIFGFGMLVLGTAVALEGVEPAKLNVFTKDTAFQFFTLYRLGTLFLLALPLVIGLALTVVPLQVGARTVAFPRAAAASFWTWFIGAALFLVAYASNGGPGGGRAESVDLFLVALGLMTAAFVLAGICIATTVFALRTAGMTLTRVPLYAWSAATAAVLWIFTLPVLFGLVVVMYVDHKHGAVTLGANTSIYGHLTWLLRNPQVYTVAIPVLGFVADVLATAARRRFRGHDVALGAIAAFATLSFGAFLATASTAAYDTVFVTVIGLVAVIPVALVLAAGGDAFRRGFRLNGGVAYAIAAGLALLVAVIAGALGSFSSLDTAGTIYDLGVSHAVLLAAVIGTLGGVHWWSTKVLGGEAADAPGLAAPVLLLVGMLLIVVPDLISGLAGTGAEIAPDFTGGIKGLNVVVVIGCGVTALGFLASLAGLAGALKGTDPVAADPHDGLTLEWLAPSPPPLENFEGDLPVVTSAEPLLDLREEA